jgi:Protein of unknown function (DUF1592)/Protein of unknown function (DUF1588)/Protein of unknown function (DUF1587)/Protein of unknown function (DUF1585)/Protein of unknown function (DUF1595)/Ca-dependent carbohydrate-binding module xylan-binding
MQARRYLPMFMIAACGPALLGAAPDAKVKPAVVAPTATASPGPIHPFLAKYCNNCHGGTKPKADLNLTAFRDDASMIRARKTWGRIKDYVDSGDMPPEGKPQPSQEEIGRFNAAVDVVLGKVDCVKESDPGRVTLRRLNRAEYNNTVRDLLGVDFHPADDFPSDDVGYGFDNIGDVLTLPPILFEKYLDAAEKIAEQAILITGPTASKGPVTTIEVEDLPDSAGGGRYSDWARTLASVGTILANHTFPRDGDYILRARAFGQQAGPDSTKMAFVIDGKTLKTVEVKAIEKDPQLYEHRVKLRGGPRKIGVSYLNDYYNEKAPDPKQRDRNLVVDYLEIQGPAVTADAPKPESHKKILFKTATRANFHEVAQEILVKFASRAYRRPLTAGEVARLVKFVDLALQNGESFERGVQLAVQAVLVSPQFLFRVELDPRPRTRPAVVGSETPAAVPTGSPISDYELASRLSYFLWSSMPDDELFGLARDGKLHDPKVLALQVRRLLRDPKSKAFVENFADQWLQIRLLKTVNPDRGRFPSFDEPLRAAMLKETELFFDAVMREDRSIADLISADFTFVNERLAKHYGLPGITGDGFRRVALKGGRRGGVLTQASVLTVTSNPTRTSPVKRGKWILEQILGTPPPPPPAAVPDLPDEKDKKLTGTLRQRMEQHRANPSCAACHARMDPLGFGFENFDAIGAWRETDGSAPVDPSGVLPSGQNFQGPEQLKAILKARDKDFARCLAEKMLTFALGRGVEYYDTCAIDKVVENTARDNYRFHRLVLEIVLCEPFQKRRIAGRN